MKPGFSLNWEFPDSLFARIAALLVLNLILIWAVAFVLYRLELSQLPHEDFDMSERVASSVQALESVSVEQRDHVARAISDPRFLVRVLTRLRAPRGDRRPPPPPDDDHAPPPDDAHGPPDDGPGPPPELPPESGLADPPDEPLLRARILEHFPKGTVPPTVWMRRSMVPSETGEAVVMAHVIVSLKTGGWADFHIRRGPPPMRWLPVLTLLASIGLVICGLSVFFARSVSRRLAAFAGAAEALGRASDAPPLTEAGPREIRLATGAFNRMQERLRRFVHDRTQMLAAISHDLRTPLTRLRLRAEFVEDEQQRDKMLHDIAEMETMISATLAFARDDATREPRRETDLDQMLDDLTAVMSDSGQDVAYTPIGPTPVTCSPVALRRAVGNLIENAVKYGQRARVALSRDAEHHLILIDDDGPGIAETMQEQVFQPFFRLETSRNRETGGVGLGLSVARTILRGHGGDITLNNRAGGGMRVTVSLPA